MDADQPPVNHVARPGPRDLWRRLEPIHAVLYFAREPLTALTDAGYRGFWMGYFAARAAPFGPASPELVHAVFYNFTFDRVARALPDAWSIAPPEVALAARLDGSVAALRRQLGDLAEDEIVHRAADLAARAALSAPTEGRALFSANRSLPFPEAPLARLWHVATLLREHRGDGHVAALLAAGISGRASHVLHSVATGTPKAVYEQARHYADAEWQSEIDALRMMGYLDDDAQLTAAGAAAKAAIEARTDAMAATAFTTLSDAELDELERALRTISRLVVRTKEIPVKSPMGLDLAESI